MVRFIIIGLSVVFFSLSAIVTFKAREIPLHDTIFQGHWPEGMPPSLDSSTAPEPSALSAPTLIPGLDDLTHSPAITDNSNVIAENVEETTTQNENQSALAEEAIEITPAPETIVEPRTLAVFDGKTFRSGQDIIHDVSYSTIEDLIQAISAYPDNRILVEGHTDNIPTGKISSDNMDLSRRRARAIANILILHGVPTTRISTIGYGDKRPIVSNATEVGRAKNRRVEVKLMPQEGVN